MATDLKAKFLGGMVGSALGDAIGELAFHCPDRQRLHGLIGQTRQLIYTDDTAMALGLAESIVQKKAIDPQHLGETFHRNFDREPWRGYASGPPTLFSAVRAHGMAYVEAAKRLFGGTGSFGNGAAMRIVPVGLFYHDSENLYGAASASAEVTHAHPVGKDGAAVLACAIAQVARTDAQKEFQREAFLESLISFSRTAEIREKMKRVWALIDMGAPAGEVAERLGQSVAVDESMPFAIYAFVCHPKSFEDCLLCAVLNGGDCDTLGAMACAISGTYLGIQSIPNAWRDKLENREIIEELASALAEAKGAG
jgi:poly(ADP-ribose) glycohydrolase ARH3